LETTPLETTPLEATGLTAANLQLDGLGGVPLSDLPLLHGKTWPGLLGVDVPLQSTTLAQALGLLAHPSDLSVGDIDWAHSTSALASLGVGAFALGAAPLANLQ